MGTSNRTVGEIPKQLLGNLRSVLREGQYNRWANGNGAV